MMLKFIRKLLGRGHAAETTPDNRDRYETEKAISQTGDQSARLTLARDNSTNREILYYLAEHDPSAAVRKAVAQNEATPLQASAILADDDNADVRLALAERLVTLLPDLDPDRHSRLYAFAVQALATLALDEVLKIRKALSTTLKDYAHTPPKVANQLARDVEREVSEPILRFCAALSDEDLLDILGTHPATWAVQAIAGRDGVSAPVSRAIIDTDDREAGVVLLRNPEAAIGADLLETIIDKARDYPEWQQPTALHKNLPPEMAEKLAEFADIAVRNILLSRDDFDQQAVEGIARIFKRRLEKMDERERSGETPEQTVVRLAREGELSKDTVADALAMRDYDLAFAAIARLAEVTTADVKKIFDMKAPKPIVAISWKAGLPMRLAYQLQQTPGHVPPDELIYPRGGTDYPLPEKDMIWQLDFLGLDAA